MGNGASTVLAVGDEIGRGAKAVTSSVEAPNYFLTFMLPFAIVLLLSYAIGWSFYRNSTGITYTEKDPYCESEVKSNCYDKYSDPSKNNMRLRRRCVSKNLNDCPSTQKKTSKNVVLLLYIFLPMIISAIFASIVYKSALYYKNPKAAALITTTKLTRDAFRGGRRSIRKRYKK